MVAEMGIRWMEQLALASAIRRAGQIQAAWRGYVARKNFRVLGLRHSMEEEALKGARVKHGKAVWGEPIVSEPESLLSALLCLMKKASPPRLGSFQWFPPHLLVPTFPLLHIGMYVQRYA